MAAGTGGHVYPALAIASMLRQRGHQIIWLGTKVGMEGRLIPQHGIDLHQIPMQGLRGKGAIGWLLLPFQLARAVYKALQILRQVRPDITLGMGGYGSAPGGVAAWLLRIPLVIHEQNAIPGLANRLLKPLARRVLVGFTDVFGASAFYTGNPVRADIAAIDPPKTRLSNRGGELRVLVIGGSQGAAVLNTVVPDAIAALITTVNVKIHHQAGATTLEATTIRYRQQNLEAEVVAFIDDMAAAYRWSDVVVCRSGAITIAEICAAGVAAILVPFPHAVDDHQTHNATYLAGRNAAVLLSQRKLSAQTLADELGAVAGSREKLLRLASNARQLSGADATENVIEHCLAVVGGGCA